MTIVLGAWRPTWSMLAADRRYGGRQPDGSWQSGMHMKVVSHHTLPLAFATSGIGSLANRPTSFFVRQFAATVTPNQLVDKEALIVSLFKYFFPLVEDERGYPCYPGDEAKRVLAILVAWMNDGHAEFGRLVMALEANNYESGLYLIGAEDPILETFHQVIGDDDAVAGQGINEPAALAGHFRNVVTIGADAERVLLHNRRLTTGGAVDVALIDEHGAHRL